MIILSIMGKNYETKAFDYFDDLNYVYEKACSICEPRVAVTVLKEFILKKEEYFKKEYVNYMMKVKQEPSLGLIERVVFQNKDVMEITVFDSDAEILNKYSKALGRKLDKKEKELILSNINLKLRENIENNMRKKGKVK